MSAAGPLLLHNTVRPYAWGSTEFIQDLTGASRDGQPAAELWLGAHPGAPSALPDGRTLAELVESAPASMLGAAVLARFGATLPFLLKVLAAQQPLSIQAHPTVKQARAGCADEDARGVPRDSPRRNYVDGNHKPEIICALTDFDALCGFRPVQASADLLSTLVEHGATKLDGFAERIVSEGGLRDVVTAMLTMPAQWQAELLASVLTAAAVVAAGGRRWAAECGWSGRLAADYPGDPGVVLALLLNLVRLAPGQALFLSAGRIHAYLRGAGVELMASSDNVLRCGLTSKHVDPPELLRVLDFSTEEVHPVTPEQDGAWARYPVPVEDFALNRLTLPVGRQPSDASVDAPAHLSVDAPAHLSVYRSGPQILLVTEGSFTVSVDGSDALTITGGESVFLAAGADATITGAGVCFQATTNIGA